MSERLANGPVGGAAAPPRWVLPTILAAAAALRLGHWLAVRRLPFVDTLVVDSAEYDRWARAIAAGGGPGDLPFFQPPLYPYLLATVYRLVASPHAVYLLQIAAALGGIYCLARAGREMVGASAGLAAAALAAVYGPFVFHDVQLLKESLAVDLVAALLWAMVVARRDHRSASWLLAGALFGLLSLLRENALLVAPLAVALAWRREDVRRSLTNGVLVVCGLALPLLPVALFNASRGGGLLPTTWQGGVNFYIGNHAGADGTYQPLTSGRQIPEHDGGEPWRIAERARGRPLGAAEVSAYWRDRALAWARERPADFARLQWRKLGLYWSAVEWPDAVDYAWVRERSPLLAFLALEFPGLIGLAVLGLGVAWRRRQLAALAPAWLFALAWMASTVAFFLFSRYRLPGLVPLTLVAGVGLADLPRAVSRERQPIVLAGLLLVAWGVSRLAPAEPNRELVHLNLGRLAAVRGDLVSAEREWRAVLATAPENAVARLELGTLAARQGRLAEARQLFAEAVGRDAGSPEAWANLGAAAAATGDVAAGRQALDRAYALDPTFAAALVNRVVVEVAAGDLGAAQVWYERLAAAAPEHPSLSPLAARIAAARSSAKP